ncbi:hypothetical protein LOAG_04980 [Loa loa]|uniref:Uncharacterized protein n=1 Tax=Loa loa TaxID=7209 RepID=A0A1S0U100_LOALO|nr:hypothetical protein LOAG_04980 [Loa loa]EFO23506.1 hypothetical protein LOAG_04980 [Loa loa]
MQPNTYCRNDNLPHSRSYAPLMQIPAYLLQYLLIQMKSSGKNEAKNCSQYDVKHRNEVAKMGSAVSNHHQITAVAAGRVLSTAAVTKTLSEKTASKQIDKQLQKEKLKNMNIFKILLLGKF